MYYIFITNTNWTEPPRIRHQLAELLNNNGHIVYFFERPILKNIFYSLNKFRIGNITILRNARIFHHRLSVGILNKLDSLLINRIVKKFIAKEKLNPNNVIIVNFVYDLKLILDRPYKVFSFINDDFEMQTCFWGVNYKKKYIINNIEASGRLISVSPYLIEKYNDLRCRKFIFLPWVTNKELAHADREKISWNINQANSVMFYGFVNERLDFDLIEKTVSNFESIKFDFYGEVYNNVFRKIKYLEKKYKNINFKGPVKFSEINFSLYFCSITPYKKHKSNQVVYVTNKLFRLSAAGLPSVNIGMPNLINHASVIKAKNDENFISSIETVFRHTSFFRAQAFAFAKMNDEWRAIEKWKRIVND